MSTLTSDSTDAEVQAAYDDNSGYDVDGSVSACRIFIQACRILYRRLAARASVGQHETQLNNLIEQEKNAKKWLQAKSAVTAGGSGYIGVDLSRFRE